jgi:hypothetical protein
MRSARPDSGIKAATELRSGDPVGQIICAAGVGVSLSGSYAEASTPISLNPDVAIATTLRVAAAELAVCA